MSSASGVPPGAETGSDDLRASRESLEYIRGYYRVPAEVGCRVRYTGGKEPRLGTITGASGPHLLAILDGNTYSVPFHPTWEIEYLPVRVGEE